MKQDEHKSRVYADRPPYADYDAPHKFMAIEAIIGKRLIEHPKALCSYSGGSDSDILLHLIERVRQMFSLPPVEYAFFNTGLEMEATKRHVREMAEKYGVNIVTHRPRKSIVTACRENGLPFMSKIFSVRLSALQRHGVPPDVAYEYMAANDKPAKLRELDARYPNSKSALDFLCCCDKNGNPPTKTQTTIAASNYMLDYICENPIPFNVSGRCCDICKKQPAHAAEKGYDMIITGERFAEGGVRSTNFSRNGDNRPMCFYETGKGQYRLRPLYYVTDADKQWYKEYYGIRYSDAYEVYGLKRTGCCGCPISSRAVEELERIRPYEPNLAKAAWAVFGDSYRYRQQYNEYKARRMREEAERKALGGGEQMSMFEAKESYGEHG